MDTKVNRPGAIQKKIGTVTRHGRVPGGVSTDAEAIKVDRDLMPRTIYISPHREDRISTPGGTYPGQSLCISGRTTGTHCGPVKSGGRPIFYGLDRGTPDPSDDIGEWLIKVATVIDNGDSGSPIYDKRTGWAVGIATAGDVAHFPDGRVRVQCPGDGQCSTLLFAPLMHLGNALGVKAALGVKLNTE